MAKKFYIEDEILFTDKKVFKDNIEHPYNCTCYDGYANCVAIECDENRDVPPFIKVTYPLRKDIMKEQQKCIDILNYRGLYDLSKKDITYGDIMMRYGVIQKPSNRKIKLCGKEWVQAKRLYNVGNDLDWWFAGEFTEGNLHINNKIGKMLLIRKDGTELECNI